MSTAPSCSTRTRVGCSSISISGRKVAGCALWEVGATTTTERGRNSSAWRTTPNRRPRCSWPRPRGGRSSWMSPLRTETFHQRSDLEHLPAVGFIRFQGSNLAGDLLAAKSLRRLHESHPDRFRTIHPGRLESGKSSLGLFVKAYGYRFRHGRSVSQFVIQPREIPAERNSDVYRDSRHPVRHRNTVPSTTVGTETPVRSTAHRG